jgi:hypothetical protein
MTRLPDFSCFIDALVLTGPLSGYRRKSGCSLAGSSLHRCFYLFSPTLTAVQAGFAVKFGENPR